MELRHLRAIVILAEELHFGRAARRLRVVQSALSRTVQDLEEQVGAILFDRSRRQVQLTAAGAILVRRAREILGSIDDAAGEAVAVSEGRLGHVRLGAAGLSAVGYVPEAIVRFRARRPLVKVTLNRISSLEQVRRLREGSVDLCFTNMPLEDPEVVLERMGSERLFAVIPTTHRLARAKSVRPDDFGDEPNILLSREDEPVLYRMFLEQSGKRASARLIEIEEFGLMFMLVAAGLGVATVPASVRAISFTGVTFVPMVPRVEVGSFAGVRRGPRSPATAEFLHEAQMAAKRHGLRSPAGSEPQTTPRAAPRS